MEGMSGKFFIVEVMVEMRSREVEKRGFFGVLLSSLILV